MADPVIFDDRAVTENATVQAPRTAVAPPLSPAEIRAAIGGLPRVSLATLPTPLRELPRLGRELGLGALYVKRDDLTGLAFGGNKVRNLEFRLADCDPVLEGSL